MSKSNRHLGTRSLRRGDVPYDRCSQDEQHRVDHNPIRHHVTSSFDF